MTMTNVGRIVEVILAATVIVTCGIIGRAASQHPTEHDLRVRLSDELAEQHAGLYVALAQGTYSKHHLNVTFSGAPASIDSAQSVADNFYDIGAAPSWDVVRARCSGAAIVPIAVDLSEPPLEWVTLRGSGIREFADLKGRRVGVGRHSEGQFLLQAVFQRIGLRPDSVTTLPVGDDLRLLKAGLVDALLVRPTHVSAEAFRLGVPVSEQPLRTTDYGIRPYGQLLFTSTTFASGRADILRNFSDSAASGWNAIRLDAQGAAGLLSSRPEFAHLKPETLTSCIRVLGDLSPKTSAGRAPDAFQLSEIAEILVASGEASAACADPAAWQRHLGGGAKANQQ